MPSESATPSKSAPLALSQQLAETAQWLGHQFPSPVSVGIILGSGLGDFGDSLPNPISVPYETIPHFATYGQKDGSEHVTGHAGKLIFSEYAPNLSLVCMQGRFHYYEGFSLNQVVYPVRVLKALGVQSLIVTNAAGGICETFQPGDLMIIDDHLNLMGHNPLRGKNDNSLGPRFPDMSAAYSPNFRQLAMWAAKEVAVSPVNGVYAAVSGPSYETPAEIRMLKALGAHAVGMSTVPEVTVANHMGMDVLGISCITNAAAGISTHPLSHSEVVETGQRVKASFSAWLHEILNQLASQQAQGGLR